MSSTGQASCVGEAGSAAVLVAIFAMPAASRYTRHSHDDHQLAWAATGVLTVVTDDGTWVLPSTRALGSRRAPSTRRSRTAVPP